MVLVGLRGREMTNQLDGNNKKIHILSLSFGKDSLAMLIEVLKRKLPLDYVIFCDIRFSKDISGEHPLMADWIPHAEKILLEEFGVKVEHLTYEKSFVEQFYTIKQRGNHIGDIYGYPYIVGAWCNDRLKMQPIRKFINTFIKQGYDIVEYIGIAKDEPKRLERYNKISTPTHTYITLADLNITEQQALEICKEHNLLSPKYTNSFRGGCWFCPKQCNYDLYQLFRDYPSYFDMLINLEKDSPIAFKANKSLLEYKKDFIDGVTPKRRK